MKNYELEIANNSELLVALQEHNQKNALLLAEAFDEDTKYIDSITQDDEEELIEEIFYSYIDIKNKKQQIELSRRYLEAFDRKINELQYRKKASYKDIVNYTKTTMLNIICLENLMLVCMISNNTPIQVLRKMLNIILITISTYIMNIAYLTSSYYKKRLKDELTNFKLVNELTIGTIEGRELELEYLTKEMKLEIIKLIEISEDYQNIEIPILDKNIEIDEDMINSLIKKRKR